MKKYDLYFRINKALIRNWTSECDSVKPKLVTNVLRCLERGLMRKIKTQVWVKQMLVKVLRYWFQFFSLYAVDFSIWRINSQHLKHIANINSLQYLSPTSITNSSYFDMSFQLCALLFTMPKCCSHKSYKYFGFFWKNYVAPTIKH